jgi:hypothetical protein
MPTFISSKNFTLLSNEQTRLYEDILEVKEFHEKEIGEWHETQRTETRKDEIMSFAKIE